MDFGEVGPNEVEVHGLACRVVPYRYLPLLDVRQGMPLVDGVPLGHRHLPDDAAGRRPDLVLHLHGLHHEHQVPGMNLVSGRHLHRNDRALHHCGQRPRTVPVRSRRRIRLSVPGRGPAVSENRQWIGGIDTGPGPANRLWADEIFEEATSNRPFAGQHLDVLIDEPGVNIPACDPRMTEKGLKESHVGLHSLDAEVSQRPGGPPKQARHRPPFQVADDLCEERVESRADPVSRVSERVDPDAAAGRQVECGKPTGRGSRHPVHTHGLHVDANLDRHSLRRPDL